MLSVVDSWLVDWEYEMLGLGCVCGGARGRAACGCLLCNCGCKSCFFALGFERAGELMLAFNSDICASAICSVGADVVWIDLWPESATKDLCCLQAVIGLCACRVMPIDLYISPRCLRAIFGRLHRICLSVLEGAFRALGASSGEHMIGSLSDMNCFSVDSSEQLGVDGFSGACVATIFNLAHQERMFLDWY